MALLAAPRSSLDATDGSLIPAATPKRKIIVCRPIPSAKGSNSSKSARKSSRPKAAKIEPSQQMSHEFEETLNTSSKIRILPRCVSDSHLHVKSTSKVETQNLENNTLSKKKLAPKPSPNTSASNLRDNLTESREIQPRNGRPLGTKNRSVSTVEPPCGSTKLRPVQSQKSHLSKLLPTRKSQSSIGLKTESDQKSESESDSEKLSEPPERYLTRARLVRRKTIMYQQGELAFKTRKKPQMFELCVIVHLRSSSMLRSEGTVEEIILQEVYKNAKYVPQIKFRYPMGPDSPLLSSLPCLCYPDFVRAEPVKTFPDQQFVITLTDELGNRKFAYCIRFLATEDLPQVAVIVSPVQSAQLYFEILRESVFRAKISEDLFREFIAMVFRQPFPARGNEYSALRDVLFGTPIVPAIVDHNRSDLEARKNSVSARYPFLASSLSASSLQDCAFSLQSLGAENFITIFLALLCEKRILLVAKDLPELSQAVQALTSVLYPFDWPHTLIPVIPDSYVELCFSPTPYVIGILRSNLSIVKELLNGPEEEFILILDLNMGVIRNVDYGSSASNERRDLPSKIYRNLLMALKSADNTISSVLSGKTSQRAVDERIRELFLLVFVEVVGHWRAHVFTQQDGTLAFHSAGFVEAPKSRSIRAFLRWFVETGIFQVWKRKRLDQGLEEMDAFDQKAKEVLGKPREARIIAPNFTKFVKNFASLTFRSST